MHMRKNVPDSPEFLKAKAEVKEEDHTPVKELFLRYKKSIITVIGLLVGSSATYYILITYMPTYISQFMGTSFSSAFIVNTSVIAINLLLCPVVGMLIDKVGRRRCLIVGCLGFLILSYPVFYILIQQTNAVLMIGLLGYSSYSRRFWLSPSWWFRLRCFPPSFATVGSVSLTTSRPRSSAVWRPLLQRRLSLPRAIICPSPT